jgi:hypothetical protein
MGMKTKKCIAYYYVSCPLVMLHRQFQSMTHIVGAGQVLNADWNHLRNYISLCSSLMFYSWSACSQNTHRL